MSRQIKVTVAVGGVELSAKLDKAADDQKVFRELVINERSDWHHSFSLRVPLEAIEGKGKNKLSNEKLEKLIGSPIKVTFYPDLKDKRKDRFFNGLITHVGLSRYKGSDSADLLLTGYSPSIMTDSGGNCRTFSEKKLKDIASKVLEKYTTNDLKSKVDPKNKKDTVPYFVQYKESDFNFLRRIAQLYGEWFYYDGTNLYFGKPSEIPSVTLTFGDDLTHFDMEMQLVPQKFKMVAYDYLSNKVHQSPSSDATVSKLDGNWENAFKKADSFYGEEKLTASSEYTEKESQLDELVKFRKSVAAGDSLYFSGSSDNPELRGGVDISIKSFKSKDDYGSYFVIKATHTVDGRGNYSNNFTAVQPELASPPVMGDVRIPICEIQHAIVKENDDPKKMGRVRVQFIWQSGSDMTPWIRMIQPHAGKDRGFYFIPEKGDQVLVGFENNNANNPYVLGSMYHKDAEPKSKWPHAKDYVKAIKTVGGNEIYINDEKDKEEIRIFNRDYQNEVSLYMDGDGKIAIKTKGNLEIYAGKSISIEAKEEIKMKSGKDTKMEAQNMSAKAQQKMEFNCTDSKTEASKSLALKTQELKAEATKAEVKASATLKIESAKTEVKGAMLDLKADGIANLQGSLVKIN